MDRVDRVRPGSPAGAAGWIIRGVSTGLGYFAGALLAIMAVFVTVDVVLRYFFNRPSAVVDEISAYLLVGIVFLGAAVTQRDHRHTNVELVIARLPGPIQYWLRIVTYLIAFLAVAVFAWQSALLSGDSFQGNRFSNSLLRTPLWIPQAVMVVGLVIFDLQILIQLLEALILRSVAPVATEEHPGAISE